MGTIFSITSWETLVLTTETVIFSIILAASNTFISAWFFRIKILFCYFFDFIWKSFLNPHNVLIVFQVTVNTTITIHTSSCSMLKWQKLIFFLLMVLPSNSVVFPVIIQSSQMYQHTITSTVRSDSNIHGWGFP